MEDKVMQNQAYGADQIQVLEGIEADRKQPSMDFGSTISIGLHHLGWEITDNRIGDALAGYCTLINVVIEEDNSITVKDNGRGIPVDIHEDSGKPAVELILTELHSGGIFGGGGYKVSGGLHGVGASVVNAVSSHLDVYVHLDNKIHYLHFEIVIAQGKFQIFDDTDK